jgi:hypothetical protein
MGFELMAGGLTVRAGLQPPVDKGVPVLESKRERKARLDIPKSETEDGMLSSSHKVAIMPHAGLVKSNA